jgi:hypothetical protein
MHASGICVPRHATARRQIGYSLIFMGRIRGSWLIVRGGGIGEAAGRLLTASGAIRANLDDNDNVGLED